MQNIKWVIYLLLTVLASNIRGGYIYAQSPKTFGKYAGKYDTIVTLEEYSSFQVPTIKKTLAKKSGTWFVITTISQKQFLKEDSAFTRKIHNGKKIFRMLLKNNLLTISDEKDIQISCQSVRDTIFNGQKISEINSLESISDLGLTIISYKFGKKSRSISYKSPAEALKICPDSQERIKFQKLIVILKRM